MLKEWMNTIQNLDCLTAMKQLPDKCIDLVLTDPPYDMKSIYLIDGLIKESERILKDGGNLLFLCGHHQLFSIIKIETILRHWWIGWLNHNRSNRIFGKNVIVKGKPFIWFNKTVRLKTSKVPMDTITLSKECWSKKYHKWEQPVEFFEHYIEFLTESNGLVLDPFIGSGTTAIACQNLKRNYIGFELDEEYCRIAQERTKYIRQGLF